MGVPNIELPYVAPRVDFELNFRNAKLHHGEYSESSYSYYFPIQVIVAKQTSSNLRKMTESCYSLNVYIVNSMKLEVEL